MKKVIEKVFCDVCKKEVEKFTHLQYPVIFYTDQTDGRSCDPYISLEKLDMCDDCASKCLMLKGYGAQGLNDYTIRKV